MNPAFEHNVEVVAAFGLKLAAALAILLVGRWLARFVARLVERVLNRSKLNRTLVSFTKNIVYFGMLLFVFVVALNKLGIETTSLVALIGAAGLAIGLALQGSLTNFAAGVMIIVMHPFEVGDTIDAGGATGRVEEIQVFNTIMLTDDGRTVIVPNSKITGDKIVVHPRKQPSA